MALVGAIGTLNLDRLRLPAPGGGERLVETPGGLCHSLGALRRLLPAAAIRPVAWLAAEDAPRFRPPLEAWGLDRAGLSERPGPGNRVTLDCRLDSKPELAELRLPPLGDGQLEPALACGVLLVNLTSGLEFSLPAWLGFRERWRRAWPAGWLQLDWHSLSLDHEPGRPRRPCRVPDWQAWVEDLDLLQLTLAECASLDGASRGELEQALPLMERILAAGCRRAVVTDGARGALWLDGDGVLRQAAAPADAVVDTTGCGDVFGAALLAARWLGHDAPTALAAAARAAAATLSAAGLDALERIEPLSPPGTSASAGKKG